MKNSVFVGSLYLAIAVAAVVAVSGVLLKVSMLTLVVRTVTAFATFVCLGWVVAVVLSQAADQGEAEERPGMGVEDSGARGAMVDVVLPATGDENS
ncbi:MAG: hypothetical protein ACUVX1_01915 [Chloroflexota bacterium]